MKNNSKNDLVQFIGPSIKVPNEINADISVFLGRQNFSKYPKTKNYVYVNVENSNKISKNELKEAINYNLNYVFKSINKKNKIQSEFISLNIGREVRHVPKFKSGHPHLFPIGLCEFIEKGYSNFYITGVNFYLSRNLYDDNYLDKFKNNTVSNFSKEELLNKLYLFAHHDLLEQFLFIKNLRAIFNISGDQNFENIINLSSQDYMNEIFKLYVSNKGYL
jgi:nucleoid DNA-binding protein